MSRGFAFCAAVGAVVAASPAAFAQRSWAGGEDGYHKHQGLFMRIDAGGGYMKTSATIGGSNVSLSGPAGSFSFSVGGNVIEDLSLFGHVGLSMVANPKVSGATPTSTGDSTLNFATLGGGANYYFMPYNFYVSGMIVMTRLTTTTNGTSGSTDAGLGAKVAVGKEWWMGDHWGIGVAGQFSLGSNPDQGSNAPTWTTITPALAFSASFN